MVNRPIRPTKLLGRSCLPSLLDFYTKVDLVDLISGEEQNPKMNLSALPRKNFAKVWKSGKISGLRRFAHQMDNGSMNGQLKGRKYLKKTVCKRSFP